MPTRNVHGGKGFKKGKKAGGAEEAHTQKFTGREDGQDYARAVRLLGDRRVLCFCNDGHERVGKIRGGICRGPRKQIIRVGDIVLISYREFQADAGIDSDVEADAATGKALTTDSGHKAIVDILHRFGTEDWRHIRKEKGIHPALLGVAAATGGAGVEGAAAAEDIFGDAGADAGDKDGTGDDDDDDDDELDIDKI
jgi:initiation factor 1A